MIDLDKDPRVTAYVLGELERDEREIFEQDLANADGGEALVREIEEIVVVLDEAYASEPEYRMTDAQRQAVLATSGGVDAGEELADADGKVLPWVVRPTIGGKDKAVVEEMLRPTGGQRAGRVVLGMGIAACLVGGMLWVFSKMGETHRDAAASPAIAFEMDSGEDPMKKGEFEKEALPSIDPGTPGIVVIREPAGPPNLVGDLTVVDSDFDQNQLVAEQQSRDYGAGFGLGAGGGSGQLSPKDTAFYFPKKVSSAKRYALSVDPGVTADWAEGLQTGSGGLVMRSKIDEYQAKSEVEGLRTTLAALRKLDGNELIVASHQLGLRIPTFTKRYPEYMEARRDEQALLASGLGENHPEVIAARIRGEMLEEMLVDSVKVTERTLSTKLAMAEQQLSQERYGRIVENQFKDVLDGQNQLSTLSIDVDTAAYANVRRLLRSGQKPPAGAVRIEEMVNYFNYAYPQPKGPHPFSVNLEVAACPWAKGHRLVRIGLKGREVEAAERADSNLVFLIDVSGSMQSSDKLPLLKGAMAGLVESLREQDCVSIVVYAGKSGLVLDATSGALQQEILSAIGRLEAGGSTNGGAGIELAYRVAKQNFIPGGVNRVILATDGDFNVGITDQDDLVEMVAERAGDNIFLTVLGFGAGNLKDELIEEISNRGNGNSFYIDTPREGHKVLVEEIGGTLDTIAKDVKIQVEFNPAKVASYRLIGYENRALRNRDFNDDSKDAGEVGAGHTVTALYQIVPVGVAPAVDPLKYAPEQAARRENGSPELLTVKLRYKQPEAKDSTKFELPLVDAGKRWEASSGDFRFAASVAGFGMLLRDSQFKGELNYGLVKELASEGLGADPKGYRKEFLELVDLASEKE